MEEFDTSDVGVHANWPDRFFAKIVDSFLAKTRNNGARVGKAMTYMFSARELFDFALPLMKAVAADPLAAESLKERHPPLDQVSEVVQLSASLVA
jgi:hypothetical protein